MSNAVANYWEESLCNALDECGATLTKEQVAIVTKHLEDAYENIDLAFPRPTFNPERAEADRLRKELDDERRKVTCKECKGNGRIISWGPHHGSDSECWKCRGEGRHLP